jgi:hypothetical protein
MDNLPDIRRQPQNCLKAESRKKCVAVHDWDGNIEGGLVIGDESMEEWIKFEGEPVSVSEQR